MGYTKEVASEKQKAAELQRKVGKAKRSYNQIKVCFSLKKFTHRLLLNKPCSAYSSTLLSQYMAEEKMDYKIKSHQKNMIKYKVLTDHKNCSNVLDQRSLFLANHHEIS